MFERPHHQQIAQVLCLLNGPLLRQHNCFFGGGTAIALCHGEYRESVDIDFLVSDIASYRVLRQALSGGEGIAAITKENSGQLLHTRDIRADQYGIRTAVQMANRPIKLEIVLEGRIELAMPQRGDEICGIATLSRLDMASTKLLANSDRWGDDGTFSRDLIDLAMLSQSLAMLRTAIEKAELAYGDAIRRDLGKALDRVQDRHGWLERCMKAMAITMPKALLWQRLRALRRVLR